ncbi:MAG: competence/damage-inducible protein A [Methylococcaceae bacterium]|nr:competence/damage-inducible protein A [Methylococcaceae bacterium]
MKPVAEIFSQGEEVISGQIVDHNAAWLSEQLTELGFAVKRHTAVGDHLDDLVALIKEIAVRADCCICTGGLGPTTDDLTAEAVSIASGFPLRLDESALQQIRQFFAWRNRSMPEANCKQAMLPEKAIRIDNAYGTAPGFALKIRRCWFVFLPGVPFEMKAMFTALVVQPLRDRFSLSPDCLITLRSIGIGESAIQQCLEDLVLPSSVQLGFRAVPDEVLTKLLFPAGFDEQEKRVCVQRAAELIGDYVFAIDGLDGTQGDLIEVISRLMRDKRHTLAVLETASQGLLAAKCLGRDWLRAAEISLDTADLDINQHDLANAARVLARQLRTRRQTNLALVQLYAGDQSDYGDKDRAIVLYNALATPKGVVSSRHHAFGAIKYKQNQAASLALDLLRRYLQDKCL